MGSIKTTTGITSLSLFLFVLIYFFYLGITTTPELINESDSLIYHIPIAENIAENGFWKIGNIRQGLGYYPAVGETILAVFILLGIPLNLFNVLGLSVLFWISYRLALTLKLSKSTSIVFASSVALLNSVMRLPINQTVDIWLAIFFLWSLNILQKTQKKVNYFLRLGFSIGLLIGAKYSGILYAFVLLVFYRGSLLKILNFKRLVAFVIPIFAFGIYWFYRNYILTGNPIYPGSLFGMIGHPDFRTQGWTPLSTLLEYEGGLWLMIQALISEYLGWTLVLFFTPLILYLKLKRIIKIDKNIQIIYFVGLANFGIYLSLPSWPGNLISDSRYLFPSFIPIILSIFLFAKNAKHLKKIEIFAVISSVAVLPQLDYHPKLILVWLIIMSIFFIKRLSFGSIL